MCRRAGKLVMGYDAVVQELASPKTKAAGIVLAGDISAGTEKEIRFAAEKYGGREVVKAAFTMDEAEDAVGKRVGIMLILDAGLYRTIIRHITNED